MKLIRLSSSYKSRVRGPDERVTLYLPSVFCPALSWFIDTTRSNIIVKRTHEFFSASRDYLLEDDSMVSFGGPNAGSEAEL